MVMKQISLWKRFKGNRSSKRKADHIYNTGVSPPEARYFSCCTYVLEKVEALKYIGLISGWVNASEYNLIALSMVPSHLISLGLVPVITNVLSSACPYGCILKPWLVRSALDQICNTFMLQRWSTWRAPFKQSFSFICFL